MRDEGSGHTALTYCPSRLEPQHTTTCQDNLFNRLQKTHGISLSSILRDHATGKDKNKKTLSISNVSIKLSYQPLDFITHTAPSHAVLFSHITLISPGFGSEKKSFKVMDTVSFSWLCQV